MLRTAQSLPLEGLLTLHFDAGRFPPTPAACYRAPFGVAPLNHWTYSRVPWNFGGGPLIVRPR